jgi:hypothetical protein
MTRTRRRHTRTKARNLVAHLRVGDRNVVAPIEDISAGGAFLRTSEEIEPGTMLAFDVARPGLKKPFRLIGLVVEAREGRGLGLRFHGLDAESTERLAWLLREIGAVYGSSTGEGEAIDALPAAAPGSYAFLPAQTLPNANPPSQMQSSLQSARPSTGVHARVPTGVHPMGSPSTGAFARTPSGVHRQLEPGDIPPSAALVVADGGHAEAQRLMVQLRGAIMQVSQLQEQLVHKERELVLARERALVAETATAKLEAERARLLEQLAATKGSARGDSEIVRREVEVAVQALARAYEQLKR